jgi:hypothetical protein
MIFFTVVYNPPASTSAADSMKEPVDEKNNYIKHMDDVE